jgi:hypothetical protein
MIVGAMGCQGPIPRCVPPPEPPKPPVPQYLVVWYAAASVAAQPANSQVSQTATYQKERANIRTAAIRLPDQCENTSAATATGGSARSDLVLQTACGVWLAELEKALVKKGYRVSSWDALRQLEKQKNISTYDAAKQLGADLVFVFNSLEASPSKAGAKGAYSLKYFTAGPTPRKFPLEFLIASSVAELSRPCTLGWTTTARSTPMTASIF